MPALNFRITAALRSGQGGETERLNVNLAAICTLPVLNSDPASG
jgi:hypothetical protein